MKQIRNWRRTALAGVLVWSGASIFSVGCERSKDQPLATDPEREDSAQQPDFRAVPGHPDYDPVILRNQLDASVKDIWEGEPNDAAWARTRESFIADQLKRDLDGIAGNPTVAELVCRTSSCRVTIDIGADQANDIAGQYPVMMLSPMAGVRSAREDAHGRSLLDFYLLFPRELRSDTEYREWYRTNRGHVIERRDRGVQHARPVTARGSVSS